MSRVLLVSNDYIGRTMAGPGIRYANFARELRKSFDVTLVVPNEPDYDLPGVVVVPARELSFRRFRAFVRRFDVLVAQRLSAGTMQYLAGRPPKVIYDLYTPLIMEGLGTHSVGDDAQSRREIAYRANALVQEISIATGDAFICASEVQRDLWLGVLSAYGRLTLTDYERDPTLRQLIDVVPFGIEPEPPPSARRVVKGVVPGIEENDKLLLWGGGVWNWFDPLTVIRAVGELRRRRSDVKLYFLGLKHPNPVFKETEMADRAIRLARELGVYGENVFFNFDWIPYHERADYLLEADLGVSAHFDHIETRFAFRTRLLDYFWAELPTVTTRGDTLSRMVEARELGRVVDFQDVAGWTDAIEELLADDEAYGRMRRNLREVRGELAWPTVVEPLARLISEPGQAVRTATRRTSALTARYAWVSLRRQLATRGPRETLALAGQRLRKPGIP